MLIKQFSEKDDYTTWSLWSSRYLDGEQTAPYLLRLAQFLGLQTHGGRGDQMGHLRVGQDVVDLDLGQGSCGVLSGGDKFGAPSSRRG